MKLVVLFAVFFCFLSLVTASLNVTDQDTLSNFNSIKQTHLNLNVTIDFDRKAFKGVAEFDYQAVDSGVNKVVLDTDALDISRVTTTSNETLNWYYDNQNATSALGTPLVILLKNPLSSGQNTTVRIYYSTSQNKTSLGIQWMSPEMTFGKRFPFVYTQGQAIHARSIYPVQDTPAVKFTVNAALTVKKNFTALFGGVSTGSFSSGNSTTFTYVQKIPIQSYLVAIAAGGDLEYRKLGNRTGVWAESVIADKAAYEFSETETFIKTAETYLTPYEWGVYNILVLPSGFPYGGMENPCLTFATPALLAGDRSMAFVIAHEISHSWTGNLVTNKNWENFWLNEGFTVFTQRKISELVYGEDMANLEASVQYKDLSNDIISYGITNNYTSLHPNIGPRDPDDAFSTVPYEKGATFLYFLQDLTGKAKFQTILQNYIKKFRLQSIGWLDWKNHFITQVQSLFPSQDASKILNLIDWDTWIMKPGFPPVKFLYKSKYKDEVEYDLSLIFNNRTLPNNFNSTFHGWHNNLKSYFLNGLSDRIGNLTDTIYNLIDNELRLSSYNYNMDTQNLWFLLSLQLKKTSILPFVDDFLTRTGRMFYIRPMYIAYAALDYNRAVRTFYKNLQLYSPIAVAQVKRDLNIRSKLSKKSLNLNEKNLLVKRYLRFN